ncbi:MAG: hypothetical protein LBG65_04495 [Puniceicoccales bacterium]|jgi:Trk-type K+ transport system membrane component|nr:hypothetical protein [Puniceicoccales bacterium]
MNHFVGEKTRGILLFVVNAALALCGVAVACLFVRVIGWGMRSAEWDAVRLGAQGVFGAFAVLEVSRLLLQERPLAHLRRHGMETFLAVLATAGVFLCGRFHEWLPSRFHPDIGMRDLTLFSTAAAQFLLLLLLGFRALSGNRFLASRRLSPGVVLMLGFALLILAGGLFLQTPRASIHGLSAVDAFFTATSAACVTGLATISVCDELTRTGQWIVLVLAQVGGFGIMSLTYLFAYFFSGGISLRNRFMLQEVLSQDKLGRIKGDLATIFLFTLGCEAAGTAAIYSLLEIKAGGLFSFVEGTGVAIAGEDRFFFALFHSVMAFCNAGFSTLRDNLGGVEMAGQEGVLAVVMLLALAGGTGFPVVQNCISVACARFLRLLGLRKNRAPRLGTNSKLVLATLLALCVGGTLAIHASRHFPAGKGDAVAPADGWVAGVSTGRTGLFSDMKTDGAKPPVAAVADSGGNRADAAVSGHGSTWFSSLFYAVAARTAGFSLDTGPLFGPATAIVVMSLMFVGGGPSSTAGGIKATTLAVALLSVRRVLADKADIEAFGRRLGDSVAHRALATIFVTFAFLVAITVLLCLLHPELPPFDLAFEAVSAVCTAGLTRDITPRLCTAAKCVLIFAMFFGRVGILTCLFSLFPRRDQPHFRYPEGSVVIN